MPGVVQFGCDFMVYPLNHAAVNAAGLLALQRITSTLPVKGSESLESSPLIRAFVQRWDAVSINFKGR
jgi:hypothetical protein